MAAELGQGRTGALTEQECSSPDTSEQALLEPSRSVSRSEPDLSSITPNTEKATESTAIMIDVHDSAVVQSEDPSLFPEPLSQPSGTLWGWKAACVAFPVRIHQPGGISVLLLAAPHPSFAGSPNTSIPWGLCPFLTHSHPPLHPIHHFPIPLCLGKTLAFPVFPGTSVASGSSLSLKPLSGILAVKVSCFKRCY